MDAILLTIGVICLVRRCITSWF